MGHDVFVSHSSKDKLYADALVAHLERSGIRCWVAPRDILPGANWAGSIIKAIAEAKLMVLVFSGHTNSSPHIRREVERAVHHGIPVAPVRIADVEPTDDLEYFLGASHWMDAITPPMEAHLARLAEKIKLLLQLPVDAPGIARSPVVQQALAPVASPPVAMQTSAPGRNRGWRWVATATVLAMLLVVGFIALNKNSARSNAIAPVVPAALSLREKINSDRKTWKIGDTWTNSLGMTFAYIPAGTFMMGSPADEVGRYDDETRHKVTLTRGFLMGTTHATRGQFAAFVHDSGYQTDAERDGRAFAFDGKGFTEAKGASWRNLGFDQADDHPVVEMSWNDATAFCDWLSRKEGKHYRLPTEAEWECAARAGTQTAYPWGNNPDDGQGFANCCDQTARQKFPGWPAFNWADGYVFTSPVGKFKPNAWGLYDMIGNAFVWCGDWYANYPQGDATDPQGPDADHATKVNIAILNYNGPARVLRGGAWSISPRRCRCASRGDYAPYCRYGIFGFRVVLDE